MRSTVGERRIIGGRYELSRVAGSGGAGRVYQAVDLRTSAVVALKLLMDHYGSDVARFAREASLLERLRHDGIVHYLDHGEADDGRPFLVMEWLDGVPLSEALAEDFGLARSVTLMKRLGEALAYAHRQGIVHRDIKPSNVLLVGGRADAAKLVDFGLALGPETGDRVTGTGIPVGTPAYMAPEVIQGQRGATPASDVFALGSLFYRCIAGQPAFTGPNVMAVLAKVVVAQPAPLRDVRPFTPAAIDRLVTRMMQKEPTDRFGDAGEFVAALLRGEAASLEDAGEHSSSSSSLGVEERRLISVLMAEGEVVRRADLGGVAEVAQRYMAERQMLPTGQLVLTFGGGGEASDLVARAARCALELRSLLEGALFVVITGPGDPRRHMPGGEVIEAAVASLARTGSPGSITLDHTTKNLLEARFVTRLEGSRVFLEAFEERDDPERLLLGRTTPFVGRKRELKMALSCYEGVIEEQAGAALIITGQAGIGKSRLREELIARLRASRSSPQVLLGRADPHYGGAYDLARRILCAAAGIRPEFPAVAARALLRSRLERVMEPSLVDEQTALLAEIAGASSGRDARGQIAVLRTDAQLFGERLASAFGDWLLAEARSHPTVLVLEDLQFADAASVALVDEALRKAEAAPLMVLGLARPPDGEVFARAFGERRRVELGLGPLPEPAIRELVDTVAADIDGIDSDSIALRSGGNPLLVEELIRAAAAGRGASAPQSVLAMLHTRFEALPALERRVARLASVFGESFGKEALAAISGELAADEIEAALARLVESEIVERVETEVSLPPAYRFRSDFWRETAYSTFVDADRVSAHRAAGELLASHGATSPIELAHHYEQGRDARACEAYAEAASLALTAGDPKAALALVDRGASVAGGGESLGRLRRIEAEAHKWAGSNELAIAAAREAVSQLPWGSGEWLAVIGELAAAEGKIGNPASVYSLRDVLVSTSSPEGISGVRAIAAARIAMQLALAGDPDAATALLEEEAPSQEALDPISRGYVLEARSVVAGVLGDRGPRVRLAESAAEAFEEGGDRRNAALLGGSLGFALVELGLYERAQRVLSRAIELADSVGARNAATVARNQLARALLRTGIIAAGQSLLREAIRELVEQRNGRLEGVARAYLAESLVEEGELEEAERQIERAISLLEGAAPLLAPALAILARQRSLLGRHEEAVSLVDRAAEIARAIAIPSGEGMVRRARIEVLTAAGMHEESGASLERARAWITARVEELDDPEIARAFLSIEEHRVILGASS